MSSNAGEKKPEKIRGWKAIAAELEVDIKTAMAFASRKDHERPLRVRKDHKGIYIRADVIAAWMDDEDQPWSPPAEPQLRQAS